LVAAFSLELIKGISLLVLFTLLPGLPSSLACPANDSGSDYCNNYSAERNLLQV
jgi:hypothetical protein